MTYSNFLGFRSYRPLASTSPACIDVTSGQPSQYHTDFVLQRATILNPMPSVMPATQSSNTRKSAQVLGTNDSDTQHRDIKHSTHNTLHAEARSHTESMRHVHGPLKSTATRRLSNHGPAGPRNKTPATLERGSCLNRVSEQPSTTTNNLFNNNNLHSAWRPRQAGILTQRCVPGT